MGRIGWFGADIFDAAWSVGDDAFTAAHRVFREIPGSGDLESALSDFWAGPARDFAKSPLGMVILRAFATMIYGPLAWQIGPQLASFVFAFPGVVRGQKFWDAWFDEVRWRTEKTAEILGGDAAGEAFNQLQLKDATAFVASLPPSAIDELSQVPWDEFPLKQLADDSGLSEWAVAMALSVATDWFPGPPDWGGLFDFANDGSKVSADPLKRAGYLSPLKNPGLWRLPSWQDDVEPAKGARAMPAGFWTTPELAARLVAEDKAAAATAAAASEETKSHKKIASDIALAFLIAGAIGTVVWWHSHEKKRA